MEKKLKREKCRYWGDLTGISGNLTGISGDLTSVKGDLSGVRGDIDNCNISSEDRKRGININDLVMED